MTTGTVDQIPEILYTQNKGNYLLRELMLKPNRFTNRLGGIDKMAKMIELTKVLNWEKLFKEVTEEDEEYIIKEGKKPVVVVMTFDNYKNLSRLQEESKKRLFEIIDRIQERTKKEDPEEIEALIAEAITSVRAKKNSWKKEKSR